MLDKTEIIPVKLDDETTLQVSVVNLGGKKDVGVKDVLFFSGVMSTIERFSNSLASTIRKVNPDKATVEFGLGLAAKEGQLTALLFQGSGDASLKITLQWESNEKKPKAGE